MKLAVFLIVLMFCVTSVYAISKDGLVLYFDFNEGTGTNVKDLSGNGNNGVTQNDVEWIDGPEPSFKKALAVENLGHVLVKDSASLDLKTPMTLEIWANVIALPDASCSLMTKADTYMLHLDNGIADKVRIQPLIWPNLVWPPVEQDVVAVNFGEWHYFAGVYDGTTRYIYIDGALKHSNAVTADIPVTTADLTIPHDNRTCCNARNLTAQVDEARIWKRALSGDEIKEIYNNGFQTASVSSGGKLTTTWADLKVSR